MLKIVRINAQRKDAFNTATILVLYKSFLASLMMKVSLLSFLGGQEVRSHREVLESPAVGVKTRILRRLRRHFIIPHYKVFLIVFSDLQILLVHHPLLSLPWRHLDPEGKSEHG